MIPEVGQRFERQHMYFTTTKVFVNTETHKVTCERIEELGGMTARVLGSKWVGWFTTGEETFISYSADFPVQVGPRPYNGSAYGTTEFIIFKPIT